MIKTEGSATDVPRGLGLILGASANSSLATLSFRCYWQYLAKLPMCSACICMVLSAPAAVLRICKLFRCMTYMLLVITMVLNQDGRFYCVCNTWEHRYTKIKENAITLGLISGRV